MQIIQVNVEGHHGVVVHEGMSFHTKYYKTSGIFAWSKFLTFFVINSILMFFKSLCKEDELATRCCDGWGSDSGQ